MQSSEQQVGSVADTRGKHRISAELKQLEQEARFLEAILEFEMRISDYAYMPDLKQPYWERWAPRVPFGINGLNDRRTRLSAGAGYFDRSTRVLDVFPFNEREGWRIQ
ncbi:hypothetical protein DM860_002381 [Cuscuta australis]|uniref:Uncharacterized protein n=1 Tax=Cuscuta australis TaxID=267555 RepID=A0A328D3D4_9ASTE|nr:hypothetical protein DM860_002381 [Cuscuta australis]